MECVFCDSPLESIQGYQICRKCQMVVLDNSFKNEEIICRVRTYLIDIQHKLQTKRNDLYRIEQKYISKEELSQDEITIREKLTEFRSLKNELEFLLGNGSQLNKKSERQLLYKLLMLSSWLTDYMNEDEDSI